MKILIGTPTYDGTVHLNYLNTLIAIMSACGAAGIEIDHMTTEGSLVEIARNRIAARVVNDPSYTHLLFIDSDIGMSQETMATLFANADLPIVGVACPRKSFVFGHNVGELGPPVEGRPGVHTCQSVGTGIMLIRREALVKVADAVTNYYDGGFVANLFKHELRGKSVVGEDVSFCLTYNEVTEGRTIYVIVNGVVTHRGQAAFTYDANLAPKP